MKKAVIYARHILYRAFENSCECQIALSKEYAMGHGYQIIGIFADEFETKQTINPAYKKMVSDLEKAQWDVIIVDNLNLFGRNVEETIKLLRKLNAYGKSIEFIKIEPVLKSVIEYCLEVKKL